MKRIGLFLLLAGQCAAADLTLWYTKPAAKGMNEALPIGNGRIGALVYAGADVERLVLNDSSLWTGDETTATGDYKLMGSYQMLGELRNTLAEPNKVHPGPAEVKLDGRTVRFTMPPLSAGVVTVK